MPSEICSPRAMSRRREMHARVDPASGARSFGHASYLQRVAPWIAPGHEPLSPLLPSPSILRTALTNQRVCDVVIATRNRPDSLRRTLRGLDDQSRRDFGVIV